MKANSFLPRAVRLFDLFFPEILVSLRIKIFRLIRSVFFFGAHPGEKIISFGEKGHHVFFGYYDITPFGGNNLLLAMKVPLINRTPTEKDEGEIGYYDLNNPELGFKSMGSTNTWCWQQGCRLQWLGLGQNQIIYNCLVDGRYGAVIKEIPSGEVIKTVKKPLYSISTEGKWGFSLDFSRLQRLRPGYGYGILPDCTQGDLKPKNNGIELVNIETGEWMQLFSLKEIAEIDPHESMNNAEHYFNHIMFNPLGEKFLFFHLWMSKDKKRYSRMFVADRNGSNLKLLNNDGSVSHYNWISNDKIILYSFIKKRGKYMYAIFNSLDGKIEYLGQNVPEDDGHPTLIKDNEILITDTYPDWYFERNLVSYNLKEDKAKIIAKFDSPRNFTGECRCDLHPRISPDEKLICVDRIINGKRNISLVSHKIKFF